MRLTRFFLRYFPPGLCIEFKRSSGKIECKEIDLLNLSPDTNIDAIVVNLIQREPLLSMNRKPKLVRLIGILVQKQREGRANRKSFTFKKALKAHQMPMTNFCCNKTGQYVVTASYDKTARILMPFQTQRDSETSHVSLSGHQNVVYAVAFNPFTGTRVATGSFDKTAKIWKTKTGELLHTLRGHDGEIVTLEFAPVGSRLCTGAMDGTAKLWDTKVGREVGNLCHDAEVSSVSHNYTGTHLVTGACDNKVMIWDVNNGKLTRRLEGHTGEISNVQFNHESNMILSSSADHTAKLWDAGSGKPIFTFDGHKGELMDAVFNTTGSTVATAGADGVVQMFNTLTGVKMASIHAHRGFETTRVTFNPQGTRLLSTGSDGAARLWDVPSGRLVQELKGHTDEIFGCSFNYNGEVIITASKDNTCRVWTCEEDAQAPAPAGK